MTFTELKKILNESVVNPNIPGKWKIIGDLKDFDYFINRAIECLMEAKTNEPDKNLKDAISLLSMARYIHRTKGVTEKLGPIDRFKGKDE